MQDIENLQNRITELKESKTCPTCGQKIDNKEHQVHIIETIKTIEKEMFSIADVVNEKTKKIPEYELTIVEIKNKISFNEEQITKASVKMEKILDEIGVLTNDKNDVEKREKLVLEEQAIPVQIENIDLSITNLNQKIDLYNQSLIQIEENKKINVGIDKSKERLLILRTEEGDVKASILERKSEIGYNKKDIKGHELLIVDFKKQEKYDNIMSIYQKCVHRDGIPVQLLKSYAIPKINRALAEILINVDFTVWLDDDDLKLKLAYNNRIDSIIDAISGSGKERTFASVALKFALNQINTKSKPTILLLDEIMGKLTEDSVEEFVIILQAITQKMKKVLIVEHNHNIDFDYLIEVTKSDFGISSINVT